jgi:hypothetical protein
MILQSSVVIAGHGIYHALIQQLHPKFWFLTSEEMGEEIFRFP